MKPYIILFFCAFAAMFSSCKKCETCVPYHYNYTTGVLGTPSTAAQTIKLCDKTDIDAYESLTNFQDADEKPIKFICK